MSLLHRHGAAHPEAITSNPASESQRTREENHTTERITHTRRNVIRMFMGAGGLVAVGGAAGLAYALDHSHNGATDNEGAQAQRSAAAPNFLNQLTLNTLTLPDTTNPPTFDAAFANIGRALQHYINFGDAAAIPNIMPGGQWGNIDPELFEKVAVSIRGMRTASIGTANDRPEDPNDLRYYALGFSIEMLKQLDAIGADPRNPKLLEVAAQVRVTIGDLPPVTTQSARSTMDMFVRPKSFVTNLLLTRVKGMAGDNYVFVDDVNGQGGIGWALENADQWITELPSTITDVPLPSVLPSGPA